jgi:hypothetical protein
MLSTRIGRVNGYFYGPYRSELPRLGSLVATQAAILFVYAVTFAAIPRQIAGHARAARERIIGSRNLSPEPPVVNDQVSSATAMTITERKIATSPGDIVRINPSDDDLRVRSRPQRPSPPAGGVAAIGSRYISDTATITATVPAPRRSRRPHRFLRCFSLASPRWSRW